VDEMPRVGGCLDGWMDGWLDGCTAPAEIGIQVLVSGCDYAIECKWGGLTGGMERKRKEASVCPPRLFRVLDTIPF